jgi:RNA polymerase sigma factor (sigma-70 family)
MTDGESRDVLQRTRTLGAARALGGHDGGSLLQRFVNNRDEAAFEVLVHRHGPMVMGVCRRILGDGPDAEDAFQATFLLLARRASTIRNPAAVGAWLHAVAVQVARRARKARSARQRLQMLTEADVSETEPTDLEWRELRPVLDEEVDRLPEKYRTPVILCYLEGCTNTEAAEQLGWPVGTVKGRLARARSLLQTRLARRGVALGASLLLLGGGAASALTAPVTPVLEAATVSQAVQVAAGAAPATPGVASLFQSVLHAMAVARLKLLGVLLAVVGVCAFSGIGIYRALADHGPASSTTPADSAVQADHKPDAIALTDPAGIPLAAHLVGARESYMLDLGGLTPQQFREQVEALAVPRPGPRRPRLPESPRVGLRLELTNVGKEPLKVAVRGNANRLTLDLQGPGAFYAPQMAEAVAPIHRPPEVVTIAPGQTIAAAEVPDLAFPRPGVGSRAYWTEPGQYRLKVDYVIGVSPVPAGTEKFGEDFGQVVVHSAPIVLKVVPAKE